MEINKHGKVEDHQQLKFLLWTPKDDQVNIAGATVDIFPPSAEHINARNILQSIRGELAMAGHLFKKEGDEKWKVALGSATLESAGILWGGKHDSIEIMQDAIVTLVETAINEFLVIERI